MTHQYAKTIRKKLRGLVGLAHERELSRALETLDSDLWKTYSSMEDAFLVCRAVDLGFLSKEDVPEKVAETITVLE